MKSTHNYILKGMGCLMLGALAAAATGCSDDDMSKRHADFDPRYKGEIVPGEADFTVTADATSIDIPFSADMDWTAVVLDEAGETCTWATVSPAQGEAGADLHLTLTVQPNEDIHNSRIAQVTISTIKGETIVISVEQDYKVLLLDPADIKDYDKYLCPAAWNPHFENGPEYMLRHDAYYSWHRMKQSEHFFVFWSPEFGDNPNAESVPAAMRVDIDDLLAKAEQFFDTNINKLQMATLGENKSMLDNYKMEIYLIYQDEWLATGSGYDDSIGALWVNPSTCQPVGSTIAHEIGHSFQYQVYADKVNKQGFENNYDHGFRYGFVNRDSGCGYWEQCAQWQAQRDYPEEQLDSYHFQVWLDNCHRHFHNEWMRYASYYLQTYWVNRSGLDAYGRIWKESVYPEDAIMTYTRLYNGNDYSQTREQLFDYAMKMATFDIDGVKEYAREDHQDRYDTKMYFNYVTGHYQISYKQCPGATGFNVIPLEVPNGGGEVTVDFEGLAAGSALHAKDKGTMVDGDGKAVGNTSNYNNTVADGNMGWRYGFVARTGDRRTYSETGKNRNGRLTFNVPAGTDYLYLVVQGSPEEYIGHAWNDNEADDAQFPYTIKLEGTDLAYYVEEVEPVYNLVDEYNMTVTYEVKLSAPGQYGRGSVDLAAQPILDFFGVSADELAELIHVGEMPSDGIISLLAENTDGSLNTTASANNGFWLDADGNEGQWAGGYIFFEVDGTTLNYGDHPGQITDDTTGTFSMRPILTYMHDGKAYTLRYTISLNY